MTVIPKKTVGDNVYAKVYYRQCENGEYGIAKTEIIVLPFIIHQICRSSDGMLVQKPCQLLLI